MKGGKAPASFEQINEGGGRIVLPLGQQEGSADYTQDGQKGGMAVPKKHGTSIPASKNFDPPNVASPAGSKSIHGFTDQEAAELANDPLYNHYLRVAEYTAQAARQKHVK